MIKVSIVMTREVSVMVDRIERISSVKGINQGIDRFFERKEGYADNKKNRQTFERNLERELKKESRPENEAGPDAPKAYQLDLTTKPTQSLFYKEGADLTKAEGKMHDAG